MSLRTARVLQGCRRSQKRRRWTRSGERGLQREAAAALRCMQREAASCPLGGNGKPPKTQILKPTAQPPLLFDPFQKWGFCPLFSSASSDSDARPARLPREILLFLRSCVHPENRRGTAGKLGGLGGLDSKAPQPGFSCYLRSQVMTSLGP